MAKKIILTILIFLLFGCRSYVLETNERVLIKTDTIKVSSPVIQDTLKNILIKDSIIQGYKINSNDTIITIKYYPYEKKFFVKAKPDTVKIIKLDTLKMIKTQNIYKENDFFSLWDYLIVLSVIVLIIVIFLKK